MPRKIRFIIPHIPHHAIQRGNNCQDVFLDQRDRRCYLSILKESSTECNVLIGAYCLMTNHVHLLLYPTDEKGMIRFMKRLSQMYSQYFNHKYGRTGKLWENRYKLSLGDPERSWVIARYIERNPLRAKIVSKAENYPYSSAQNHLCNIPDVFLTYDLLSGDYDGYREFFDQDTADDSRHLKEIEDAAQQGKALGNEDFINECAEIIGADLKVRRQGRQSLSK